MTVLSLAGAANARFVAIGSSIHFPGGSEHDDVDDTACTEAALPTELSHLGRFMLNSLMASSSAAATTPGRIHRRLSPFVTCSNGHRASTTASVVVVTYNDFELIKRTLESLLANTRSLDCGL